MSVAALLVATGLVFAATTARAGTPNATTRAGTPNATARAGTPSATARAGTPNATAQAETPNAPKEGVNEHGETYGIMRTQTDDHGRDIPVFKADGATRLGTFHVTGAGEGPTVPPVPLR